MTRFAGVLRQVSDGLELPQPTKSRILLEMAGDLEDLYRHHVRQGCDEAEATQRAAEAFAASDEALKHLARIHESGGGLTDRITRQVGSPWEKALLVVWLLGVLALASTVATDDRFFLIVSPFVWPIVGLAAATFAVGLWKVYEIFLRKPLNLRRLRSGLGVLLFLAAASLVVAGCGFLYHLRWYAFQAYEGAPESVFMMAGGWLLAVSSMMIIALLTAVLAALAWFLLANLVARVENREADALLAI